MTYSECFGSGETSIVDQVYHRGCRNHPATKVPTIQAFDGILASCYAFEFDVNIAVTVGIDGNVDDFPIRGIAFQLDILFQFFDPVLALLSVVFVSTYTTNSRHCGVLK
jgi:hypothetical protein